MRERIKRAVEEIARKLRESLSNKGTEKKESNVEKAMRRLREQRKLTREQRERRATF